MDNRKIPGRAWAQIDLSAVENNFERMRELIGEDTKICAVIKTDAYGHGAVPIARKIEGKDYIWGFAVATCEEAVKLRENGIVKPILILGYVFQENYPELVRYGIRPAVFTYEMAEEISAAAVEAGKTCYVHIAVDTGMTRIGFPDTDEAADCVERISKLPGIAIEGLFTHFARADEKDKSFAAAAMKRYLDFSGKLEERKIRIPIRHISNSAGILELPEANLDMVRAGITIYGIYPSDDMIRDKKLKAVMQIKSHVAHVKTVSAGVPVSYGGTFVTEHETTIATIPVGYGDGYPRSLSNKGYILIDGKKAPILGRVCMDQFMVDVTGLSVRTGDEVTLMGESGDEEITVDELGHLSGRFPYEFICDISGRVPRVYTE